MNMNLTKDSAGYNTFGLPFSKFKYDTTLVTGAEQTMTIPASKKKWLAIFVYTPGGQVWVSNNQTATLPGGAFAVTYSELNPVAREVRADDVLHFITGDSAASVGVVLYAI